MCGFVSVSNIQWVSAYRSNIGRVAIIVFPFLSVSKSLTHSNFQMDHGC